MTPQSGSWVGIFVIKGFPAVQVTADLAFGDDGTATGDFQVYPAYPENDLGFWSGPTSGGIDGGGYSPFGSLHFEIDADEAEGGATFDGRYESPTEDAGVIFGNVLIGDGSQSGVLMLVFQPVPGLPGRPGGGIWAN